MSYIDTRDEAYQKMLAESDYTTERSSGEDTDSLMSLYDPGELVTFWDDDDSSSAAKHQVFLSVEIVQMSNIDTVAQTFDCRFNLVLKWMGSKQDKDSWDDWNWNDTDNKKRSFEPSWEPGKPEMPNVVRVESLDEGQVEPEQLGHMFMLQRKYCFDCRFSESLELYSFPFDAQEFPLRMSWQRNDAEIRPSVLSDFLCFDLTKMALGEWMFTGPMVSFGSKAVQIFSKEDFKKKLVRHPRVLVSLRAHRVFKTTVINVYVILSLIALTSLGAFTIEVEEGGGRLSHSSTILLASVAFLYVIESSLPKLSYMTITDYFVFWGVMYVLGVTIVVAVMSYLMTHGELYEFTFQEDNLIVVVCFGIWVLYVLGFAAYIRLKVLPKERRRFAAPGAKSCSRLCIPDFSMKTVQYHHLTNSKSTERKYYWEHNKSIDIDSSSHNGNKNPVSGVLWNSRDYYTESSGDVEYFTSEVIVQKDKPYRFVMRTVVGDSNVRAGQQTIRAQTVPVVGGAPVDAEMKMHSSSTMKGNDEWTTGRLQVIGRSKMIWKDKGSTRFYYSTDEAGDGERAIDQHFAETTGTPLKLAD